MRTDENGVQHPVGSDEVTQEGIDHIRGCDECRATFAGHWLLYFDFS